MPDYNMGYLYFVPRTGFEPAHRNRRYHLKVVCLPISPPGHMCSKYLWSNEILPQT